MKIIALAFYVLLSGCIAYDAARLKAYNVITDAADRQLEDALVLICDAPTAGALRRKWGGNRDAIDSWQAFCSFNRPAVPPL